MATLIPWTAAVAPMSASRNGTGSGTWNDAANRATGGIDGKHPPLERARHPDVRHCRQDRALGRIAPLRQAHAVLDLHQRPYPVGARLTAPTTLRRHPEPDRRALPVDTSIRGANDAGRTSEVVRGRDRDHGLVHPGAGRGPAQDTPISFRPACELLTVDAVSAVLGVEVTPADGMPDAFCSYLVGTQEVASIRLQFQPSVRARSRWAPPGATDTTVGGVPALTSVRGGWGSAAVVIVGSQDGGTVEVQVDRESGADSPLAAVASPRRGDPGDGSRDGAHLRLDRGAHRVRWLRRASSITRAELKRLTGRTFTEGRGRREPEPVRVPYPGPEDGGGPGHRGGRSRQTALQRDDQRPRGRLRARRSSPAHATSSWSIWVADSCSASLIRTTGKGVTAQDLPALRVAIAEAAIRSDDPGRRHLLADRHR